MTTIYNLRPVRRRSMMPRYTRVANGDIYPSRFVKLDRTRQGRVVQADGSTPFLWGISQAEVRGLPSLASVETRAAAAGENCFVFGFPADNVYLELGGACHPGDFLTADADGKGVATTDAGDWIGAVALQHGFAGHTALVQCVQVFMFHGAGFLLAEDGSSLLTEGFDRLVLT